MQKNKFVHKDIRALCSSAVKKLVALGLVAAVGGTYTVEYDNRLLASAQRVNRIGNGNTQVVGNGITRVFGNGITQVAGNGGT